VEENDLDLDMLDNLSEEDMEELKAIITQTFQSSLDAYDRGENVWACVFMMADEDAKFAICETELAAKQFLVRVFMTEFSHLSADPKWCEGTVDEKISKFFDGNIGASYDISSQKVYVEEPDVKES
jgi:hypothetical protein